MVCAVWNALFSLHPSSLMLLDALLKPLESNAGVLCKLGVLISRFPLHIFHQLLQHLVMPWDAVIIELERSL